jgi:hypothetical protein
MHFLQADDDNHDNDKLKVLNDGDGINLIMSIYSQYISEDDYVNFMPFCKGIDTLILKFRGGRGLTKEDRLAMEQEAESNPKRNKGKKKKSKSPPPASDTPIDNASNSDNNQEVTASDIDTNIEDFFTRYLKKAG